MKSVWLVGPMLALLVAAMPAWGANDSRIENLTLCRDSWLDWKNTDPSAFDSFGNYFRSEFAQHGDDGSFTPKSPLIIDGLKVTQVYPGSLGMGLGFSVLVDAPFDMTKQAVEHDLGKSLGHCEASDGMRSCELSIAEQRTVLLASNDPPNDMTTLVGCYYFYEK